MFHGLNKEDYDREYSDKQLVARIYRYFKPFARQILIISAITVTRSVMNVLPRIVVANGLDRLVADRTALDVMLEIVGFVLLGGIIDWAGNWAANAMTARVVGSMITKLRNDAFAASMRHDMSFFDEYNSGRVISRITGDTQEFASMVSLVTNLIGQMLQLIFLMGYMGTREWRLTLGVLAFAPVVIIASLSLRRLARKVTREGFRVMAEVNASIQEAVTGISVAKSFRQEAAIYDEFSGVNNESYRVNLRRGFTLALTMPMLRVLSALATSLIIYFGGRVAIMGGITIGNWYLFVMSMDRFWFPIINISAFWNQFQGGLSAAERVFALVDAEPTVQQVREDTVPTLGGEISFEAVNFRYTEQETVLNDFSLHIQPGESVALVGHTGAGKSSLANLIARFYEFQDGAIRIDGLDIRSLDLVDYRRQLGIVSQSPFLFDGTIADNIRYGQPGISDEDIESLSRQIGEGEWLDALPEGLATNVGERGARLSMGQRQLVALMRVLVQHPAIFILDEATASIDPFTEAQIQDATDMILQSSTSILIAHRLSTIRAVDRIIVLRDGQIIEQGSHDDLMSQGGHYAELYDTYFRHQSPDYRPPELSD